MAGVAATCFVSIFAAQVLLAGAAAVHLARVAAGQARYPRLAVDAPILAFAVWTLLSASFARDPLAAHESSKQLVLFVLLYAAVDTLRERGARERVLDSALLGAAALAGSVVVQYHVLGFDTLTNRPRGFLGHYMTAAGLAMGALVIGCARLGFSDWRGERPARTDLLAGGGLVAGLGAVALARASGVFAVETERLFVAAVAAAAMGLVTARGRWPTPSTSVALTVATVAISAWALVLTQTRNAWLGALVGLVVLAVLHAPRSLWFLAAGLALLLALRPAPLVRRLTVTDASARDRYYMWQAGLDMIRDRPVFGQGPGMVERVYPDYRWPDAPNLNTPHLHDNVLHLAAERGLPAVAWWIWWLAAVLGDAWRAMRRRVPSGAWCAAATVGFLAALLVAGVFEYNFGDSEVLMLALLVAALPYALAADPDPHARSMRSVGEPVEPNQATPSATRSISTA